MANPIAGHIVRLPQNVADGIVRRMEELEAENARLSDEKVSFELRASVRITNLERRLYAMDKLLAEVGGVADRCAQALTVVTERVDGLAAREVV